MNLLNFYNSIFSKNSINKIIKFKKTTEFNKIKFNNELNFTFAKSFSIIIYYRQFN